MKRFSLIDFESFLSKVKDYENNLIFSGKPNNLNCIKSFNFLCDANPKYTNNFFDIDYQSKIINPIFIFDKRTLSFIFGRLSFDKIFNDSKVVLLLDNEDSITYEDILYGNFNKEDLNKSPSEVFYKRYGIRVFTFKNDKSIIDIYNYSLCGYIRMKNKEDLFFQESQLKNILIFQFSYENKPLFNKNSFYFSKSSFFIKYYDILVSKNFSEFSFYEYLNLVYSIFSYVLNYQTGNFEFFNFYSLSNIPVYIKENNKISNINLYYHILYELLKIKTYRYNEFLYENIEFLLSSEGKIYDYFPLSSIILINNEIQILEELEIENSK